MSKFKNIVSLLKVFCFKSMGCNKHSKFKKQNKTPKTKTYFLNIYLSIYLSLSYFKHFVLHNSITVKENLLKKEKKKLYFLLKKKGNTFLKKFYFKFSDVNDVA